MAELIRKDKLIDWTYRVPKYYDSMNDRTDMRDFINNLPTITEAEIRARAYERFAKALLTNEVVDKSVVRRVAEQLKEE